MDQLDDVYSDLRLNYETPKGLISLASLSVAKPTLSELILETSGKDCAAGSSFENHQFRGVPLIAPATLHSLPSTGANVL